MDITEGKVYILCSRIPRLHSLVFFGYILCSGISRLHSSVFFSYILCSRIIIPSVSFFCQLIIFMVILSWKFYCWIGILSLIVVLICKINAKISTIFKCMCYSRKRLLLKAGVCFNQALINFALYFLEEMGYTLLQASFFMRKYIIAKCAQLAQLDEELCYTLGVLMTHKLFYKRTWSTA